MTISYAWYGSTTDSCRLAARCDADGDVTLTLSDGRAFTETAATAVNDGVVLFAFDLPVAIGGSLSQNGETYPYPLTIKPIPTDRLRYIDWSCGNFRPEQFLGLDMIRSFKPDLVLCLGDLTYPDLWTDRLDSWNGETITNTQDVAILGEDIEIYRGHHRQLMKDDSFKRLHAEVPMWYMRDDHEVGIDNYCGSVNWTNKFHFASGKPVQVTSQAEVYELYSRAQAMMDAETMVCNPRNTDAGIDADATYFRCRAGNLIEFFVPDCVAYKDVMSNPPGSGDPAYVAEVRPVYSRTDPAKSCLAGDRTGFGAPVVQKTWLKNALAQSEADGVIHKVIGWTKQMYHNLEGVGAGNNTDTFAMEYRAERDELVEYCGDLTSCVHLQHDNHEPAVYKNATNGFLGINACSLSSGLHEQGFGYAEHVAWKIWGKAGGMLAPDQNAENLPREYPKWVFGLHDVTPEKQVNSVIDARSGKTVFGPWPVYSGKKATDTIKAKRA